MDSRIIPFQKRGNALFGKKILYFLTIFLSRVAAATRSFAAEGADYGSRLQKNNPIVLGDVVGMDRDVLRRHFFFGKIPILSDSPLSAGFFADRPDV